MTERILLRRGRLIDPVTDRDETTDILVEEGIIASIGKIAGTTDGQVVELEGKIVAPGLLDMHVHLREPGFEHKETIESGTLAAAYGGFTGVCSMPNTNPAIDDESLVRFVITQGKSANGGLVDVFPIAAVTNRREGKELSAIAELVQAGAVGLSDDGAPVFSAEIMRRAFEYAGMYGVPVIQHCEDRDLAHGGVMNEGKVATELGLPGIPPIAEETMLARDLLLAQYCGARYHVAHLSTAGSVALVREAKARGVKVTCEVTPHHFTLEDESVRSFDTNMKINPPLRTRNDIEAIKAGLADGTIDVIATDHAPHSLDEKEVDFLQAPFGVVGLETAVGLVFTELVHTGILTLAEAIAKLSTNPRAIIGKPVRIAVGEPANFTFLDEAALWTVLAGQLHSKSKNTPFGGRQLRGRAIGVLNHGRLLSA